MFWIRRFLDGATAASKIATGGMIVVCIFWWTALAIFYDADNLRAGGQSVMLGFLDAYGSASVDGERLRNCPGEGPLVFYTGASLAGGALSSPEDLQKALRKLVGPIDLRGIWVGAFTIWQMEALASNLDETRDRVILLPINMPRFGVGLKRLRKVTDESRLLLANTGYWRSILESEGINPPLDFHVMLLNNFSYLAKRKFGLWRQLTGEPPLRSRPWTVPIRLNEWKELQKMWSDPTYNPFRSQSSAKSCPGGLCPTLGRIFAHKTFQQHLTRYRSHADEAESMIVRSVLRLQERGIRVILFETPMDLDGMRSSLPRSQVDELLLDLDARTKNIVARTGAAWLPLLDRGAYTTNRFSDWFHLVHPEARARFTRGLARQIADLLKSPGVDNAK